MTEVDTKSTLSTTASMAAKAKAIRRPRFFVLMLLILAISTITVGVLGWYSGSPFQLNLKRNLIQAIDLQLCERKY
ncbi:hypothetical protein BCR33DRAFT_516597 [Rhizoclosmatium globosum]|uniref:Uncharacterized protein n=1 Tax=Rhizoclosmatium globosum TaxID=329046 RepID=A0A1Y2BIC7_9FUNG|nr:hypothetical protein BCR33DRAFT_516597 [Rhizoclosmatium globosum]|eukprot:ORY33845.1 hypothetical protein BCR33DRAFT_516597 [Rhizoclosmatium globosum]